MARLVTRESLGIGDENYIKELRSVAESLLKMGNQLDATDDVRENNGIGFNKIDKGNWGKYQANRNLSNMSDEELVILVSQLQRTLAKYSRGQLPKIFSQAEVDRVMNFQISHVVSKTAISFVKVSDSIVGAKVKGYIDKSIFRDFLNVMKKYGFTYNPAFNGSTTNRQNFSKIDFMAFANDLDVLQIDVFEPNKSLLEQAAPQTDADDKNPQAAPVADAVTIMVSTNGRELIFKPSGYMADKFQQYRALLQQFGIRARKELDYRRREAWVNYAPGMKFPYSDFKVMAKSLGFDVSQMPDGVQDTSQNISQEDIALKQKEINMFGKAMVLVEGDMFVIRFPYDRPIIEAIKTKMKRIKPEWDDVRKAWKTKDLDTALEILQFFKEYRPDWEIDTTAIDKAVEDRDVRNAELRKPIPEVEEQLDPKFKLFPYQNEGVRFLNKTNGNALIGDEMGLGKTLQTLAWCVSNNKRALIVCPKNMRLTWVEEAMKFFPGYYSGKTAELKAADIRKNKGQGPDLTNVNLASVNYQSVGKFEQSIKDAGFDVIVMDESHRVKDPKAQQTQKLLQLSQLFPHHILLSGTAIKNKKEELATQLAIVAPQMGITAAQLKRMSYGQLKNVLHDVYIQRQKSNVLKDLPLKTQKNLNVEMPGLPAMPKFIAPGGGSTTYTVQDEDGNTYELNSEYVAKYRKKMADSKAIHTAEFVQNIIDDTDENVLVFTESVQAAKEIVNALGPIALLHYGSMKDDDREKVKKDFMDPAQPYRVLVSTTASLKEGATLTKASTVVFNDVSWTAADMAQAEARTHRPGQKKPVSVYWMTAAGHPWDEKLNAILRKKYLIHKKVNLGENLTPEEQEFLNTKIDGEEELEKIVSLGGKKPKKDTENQGPEEPYEMDDETVVKSKYKHRILAKASFRV